jgi:SAM-dependent methyltransferase
VVSDLVNDRRVVRREYASEDRFLARRLSSWAELDGPLVEDVALTALLEDAPGRVLEVGSGTGDFTKHVHDALDGKLIAVDLSARMVALTRQRGIGASVADIEALPFEDGAFDSVLANRVLYHLPNLDRGLREIVRVLRPGGRLVAVTYSERHLIDLYPLLNRPLISSTFSAESGAVSMSRHFTRLNRHDVSGTAIFATTDALRGFAAPQFGVDEAVPPELEGLPMPFRATYHHSVLIGRTSN